MKIVLFLIAALITYIAVLVFRHLDVCLSVCTVRSRKSLENRTTISGKICFGLPLKMSKIGWINTHIPPQAFWSKAPRGLLRGHQFYLKQTNEVNLYILLFDLLSPYLTAATKLKSRIKQTKL